MDLGAISRDFDRKILRPRKFFENFGRKSAENRVQSHVPHHADARHSCWGPLIVVSKLCTTGRHGFLRDLTRTISDEKFHGPGPTRAKFSKFSVRNRTKSHAAQHADARNICWGPLRVVSKLRTTRRHEFLRDLTRFRMKNFAVAQKFRNFRSEIARNLTWRSMLMLGTVVWDL